MNTELEDLASHIRAAISGVSDDVLDRHPSNGAWSCAQILEHLDRSYTGTIRALDRVLQAGHPLATPLAFKWRMAQFVVLDLRHLPDGRKAPKNTEPLGIPLASLRRDIFDHIATLETRLTECQQRFGNIKMLDHPVLHALTPDQWRRFHLVHGLHHIKQLRARRLLSSAA